MSVVEVGDYITTNEDLKVICTDNQVRKLDKYSCLQITELSEHKTILYSLEYDFSYDVGGIAFGLFPPEGQEGNGRYFGYKEINQEASTHWGHPAAIINLLQCCQENDENIIRTWIEEVIAKNQSQVEKYKKGNEKLFGFFVGQIMKSHKDGNPDIVNKLLKEMLSV